MNAAASAAAAASVSALNTVINSSQRSGPTVDLLSVIHSVPDWVLVLFAIFFLMHGFKMIHTIFSRT